MAAKGATSATSTLRTKGRITPQPAQKKRSTNAGAPNAGAPNAGAAASNAGAAVDAALDHVVQQLSESLRADAAKFTSGDFTEVKGRSLQRLTRDFKDRRVKVNGALKKLRSLGAETKANNLEQLANSVDVVGRFLTAMSSPKIPLEDKIALWKRLEALGCGAPDNLGGKVFKSALEHAADRRDREGCTKLLDGNMARAPDGALIKVVQGTDTCNALTQDALVMILKRFAPDENLEHDKALLLFMKHWETLFEGLSIAQTNEPVIVSDQFHTVCSLFHAYARGAPAQASVAVAWWVHGFFHVMFYKSSLIRGIRRRCPLALDG